MKIFSGLRLLALAVVLTGANRAHAAVDMSPYKSFLDVEYKNVGGKSLGLDIYLPPNVSGPAPLVVFVHGGAWMGRTKSDGLFYAQAFLKKGYVFASVDYRYSSDAIFPAQIEDVKAAVRFLRMHAADYQINPDKIGAMGHSAGGQLAALLGTTNDDAQYDTGDNTTVSSSVQAVCDMSGPVDLLAPAPALNGIVAKLLGGAPADKEDLAKLGSPIDHITDKTVPFLIMHGEKDPSVPIAESQDFLAALQKAGVSAQLIVLTGQPHDLNVYAHTGAGNYLDLIVKFFDSVLKK